MSSRIAIPIHDVDGRLVAYCGRSLDGSEPRYRFAAEFRKSDVLFNYHRALATAREQMIVVEGFFDCMRVHQAGFPNVVALMGSQLSRAQKGLLAGRFSQVVLMLDGDETGRAAMARVACEVASKWSVMQVRLPDNMQPDQMTAYQIRDLLTGAKSDRRLEIKPN